MPVAVHASRYDIVTPVPDRIAREKYQTRQGSDEVKPAEPCREVGPDCLKDLTKLAQMPRSALALRLISKIVIQYVTPTIKSPMRIRGATTWR